MTTVEFLSYLHSLDVKIWADSGQLCCNAPQGVLTGVLRKELTERKEEILGFLRATTAITNSLDPPLQPASRDGELLLSYAQQRLWFLDQLVSGNPIITYQQPTESADGST